MSDSISLLTNASAHQPPASAQMPLAVGDLWAWDVIIQHVNDAIIVLDATFRVRQWNRAAEQIYGWRAEEVVGQLLTDLLPGRLLDGGDLVASSVAAIQRDGVWSGIVIHPHRDGRELVIDSSVRLVRGAAGTPVAYIGINRDATERVRAEAERKQLEAQLLQSQKMESIGRLAGGVAHDFHNLLTAMLGYVTLALKELPPESPARSDMQEVQATAERASLLTRQLLAFARKQVLTPEVLDLNTLLGAMHKLLTRLIGPHVLLPIALDPALPAVKVDRGQIEQLVLNLAVNARDAMPNGGTLLIETRTTTLGAAEGTALGLAPGKYVLLVVSDTGVGMPPEVQERVFEPFFTTKEQGHGTGLGLATCYGIVKQHGGHITLTSAVGKGTTMRVYLPASSEMAPLRQKTTNTGAWPRGSGQILLVEDEAGVRLVASRTLRGLGYTVVEATSGDEALHLLEDDPANQIDLLITDVMMPGIGGETLVERAAARYPLLKVLYISGYVEPSGAPRTTGTAATFLQKPFTPMDLARTVHDVLAV